jgi:hypothetical protein
MFEDNDSLVTFSCKMNIFYRLCINNILTAVDKTEIFYTIEKSYTFEATDIIFYLFL